MASSQKPVSGNQQPTTYTSLSVISPRCAMQFQDSPSFKKWLSNLVFNLTYNKEGKAYQVPEKQRKVVAYDKGKNGIQQLSLVAEEHAMYGKK